ncbi:MAG: 50S ribosomal protein L11 methyltransferase [Bacillota bacterium]
MDWTEIKISTTHEALPAISNILEDLGANGLIREELADDLLIKSYLATDEALTAKLSTLKSKIRQLPDYDLDIGSGQVRLESIPDQDWSSSWKENFKPERITNQLVIKPTWEEYQPQQNELIIELDPGMAFGTGSHATTTMCLQAIEDYSAEVESMLDIGTGTGILSIGAHLLGIEEIVAIDIDSTAVEVAQENIALNEIESGIEVKEGDLLSEVENEYDLVVANLLPHIIVDLITNLDQVLAVGSSFILSGITVEKQAEIEAKLTEYDQLEITEIQKEAEWVTIIGERCN